MNTADRDPFAKYLSLVYASYPHAPPLTTETIQAFWGVLAGYPWDDVRAAMDFHLGDYETNGHRIPTPADIRRILEVDMPAAQYRAALRVSNEATVDEMPWREKMMIARVERQFGIIDAEQFGERMAQAQAAIADVQRRPGVLEARRYLHTFHKPLRQEPRIGQTTVAAALRGITKENTKCSG